MSTQKPTASADPLEIIEHQAAVIASLEARIAELEAEILRLRKDPPAGSARAIPSFVRPNRAPREERPRKKRDRGCSRRTETATATVTHEVSNCPDCGRGLQGGWLHGTRQVVDIPVMAYEVVEHRLMRRYCGVCKKSHVAQPDLSGLVLGNSTFGVRVMSLICHLKTVCRMQVRPLRTLLKAVYGLEISSGEIVEILHAVAREGEEHYEQLREALRQSEYVHADETGWRQDGENGYIWVFSLPGTHFFVRDKSRGHHVPEGVLGSSYGGILVSDFYGGYNYHLGRHQRCWVHYLRDLHELKEKFIDDKALCAWVNSVIRVYEDARGFHSNKLQVRIKARERFQARLEGLGEPYARTDAKQSTMADRIMRFSNELFTFVEHLQVPSENNAAERAIRPAVIDRKVSGGTRSDRGSHTKAVLMSLFRTWETRGMDTLVTCRKMLTHQLVPT